MFGRRLAVGVTALALASSLLLSPTLRDVSYAATYPSWQDVLDARNDEAAKKRAIAQLQGLLDTLTAAADEAQAEAQRLGTIFQEAQQKFDEAAFKADQLQQAADTASQEADDSRLRAGQFISELARVGSVDLSTSLLSDASGAEDLLSRLGFASIIAEQADGIYERAMQDQNTAQSLTDQATVARELRDELRAKAEAAFTEAQTAAIAAQSALDEQLAHEATLRAQLATLIENRKATEEEYQDGVEAANNQQGSDLPAGSISASGWANPTSGYISSNYGYRVHPIYGYVIFHAGTDVASGCGTNIYAAAAGTVIYAGWNGGYGNFIMIDHGDGVTTSYGHSSTLLVRYGDRVSAGTHISEMGTTGSSTGCHLHFEVRRSGTTTDPVAFLRGQGASLG
ncbi:MAG: peptidoglycan DD-metalloendopeptidase family protein [Microbacteriaceae bacterium]